MQNLSFPPWDKPMPTTVEAWSLNHWATREVPDFFMRASFLKGWFLVVKDHSSPAPYLQVSRCFLDGASSYCFLTTPNSDWFLSWQVKWWWSGRSWDPRSLRRQMSPWAAFRTGVSVCECTCAHACSFPSAQCVGGLGKACFMPLHCHCSNFQVH